MKKLNKKGFTLVELLVVIVILVIIMSIAIPSVTSSLERSKQKQRTAKIQLIESAAELYADRHKNSFGVGDKVSIGMLISENFLTKDEAIDPFTNNQMQGCVLYNAVSTFKYEERESECVGAR